MFLTKLGLEYKGLNESDIPIKKDKYSAVNRPIKVEAKMTESKIRSGVNWPGAFKQKGIQNGLDKAFVFVVSLSPSKKVLI
jgi:hypothetical protein